MNKKKQAFKKKLIALITHTLNNLEPDEIAGVIEETKVAMLMASSEVNREQRRKENVSNLN